ncbi:MAG TPA: hypothetical protein QGF05_11835 [Dehalococcoidia bacterium]|jgi:hypothetical protein|nr:hypothetical protein [Dehalococcoidia bacterium]
MPRRLPRCEACGEPFDPDPYNEHRQRYCTRDKCVLKRKRERNRRYYKKRYGEDRQFAEQERKRCAAAGRERRARSRAAPDPDPAPDLESVVLLNVLTGVVSQLTDTDDPVRLRASLHRYEERGQRMALPAPAGADP